MTFAACSVTASKKSTIPERGSKEGVIQQEQKISPGQQVFRSEESMQLSGGQTMHAPCSR